MAGEGEVQLPAGDGRDPTAGEFADLQAAMSNTGLDFGEGESTPAGESTPPAEPSGDPSGEPGGETSPEGGETLPADLGQTPPIEPQVNEEKQRETLQSEESDAEVEALQIAETAPDGVKQLRVLARDRGKQVKDLQDKVQRLQSEKQKPAEVSKEMQQRMDRAEAMYASLALHESPEFKQKYDTPIQNNISAIAQILTDIGVKEDSVKNFKERIEKAEGISDAFPQEWMERHFYRNDEIPQLQRDKIRQLFTNTSLLQDERNRELGSKLKNIDQVASEERTRIQKWASDQQTEIQSHIDDIRKSASWAQYKQVPANATPEQKAEIENHNKFAKLTEIRFESHLFPKTNRARVQTAAIAAWSYKLADDLKSAYKIIDGLRAVNNKLKGAGKMNKQGASVPKTPSAPAAPSFMNEETSKMSSEQAISSGLDQALSRKA